MSNVYIGIGQSWPLANLDDQKYISGKGIWFSIFTFMIWCSILGTMQFWLEEHIEHQTFQLLSSKTRIRQRLKNSNWKPDIFNKARAYSHAGWMQIKLSNSPFSQQIQFFSPPQFRSTNFEASSSHSELKCVRVFRVDSFCSKAGHRSLGLHCQPASHSPEYTLITSKQLTLLSQFHQFISCILTGEIHCQSIVHCWYFWVTSHTMLTYLFKIASNFPQWTQRELICVKPIQRILKQVLKFWKFGTTQLSCQNKFNFMCSTCSWLKIIGFIILDPEDWRTRDTEDWRSWILNIKGPQS